MNLQDILPLLDTKPAGSNYLTFCPAHDDKKRSLSIGEKEGRFLAHCHAGCEFKDVIPKLEAMIPKEVHMEPEKPVETYDYHDAEGNVIYTVTRTNRKNFWQNTPDGQPMSTVQRLLFHLPALIKEKTVFFVEGEKDVMTLERLGLTATTVSGGANKTNWKPYFSGWMKGKDVILLPDNDDPGIKFMTTVANHLLPVASSVKLVELPDLGPKEDVSDWVKRGHTVTELREIISTSLEYSPDGSSEPIPLSVLARKKPAKQKWMVENLVPMSNTTVIAAQPGQYKTYLTFEMMFARQDGMFLDTFKTRKGKTLFIDGENGIDTLARRIRQLRDDLEPYGNSIYCWYREATILGKEFVREVIKRCQLLKCDTVVFDPYRQFMGGDEDSSGDAANFTRLLTMFHKEGIAVILIHHIRKAGNEKFAAPEPTMDEIRGSSALNGHARSILMLKKTQEGVMVYQVKNNLSANVDPFLVKVADGPRFSWGDADRQIFSKQEEAGKIIIGLLQTGGMFRKHILDTMVQSGYVHSTSEMALKGLFNDGLIARRKEDDNQHWYYITKDDQKELPEVSMSDAERLEIIKSTFDVEAAEKAEVRSPYKDS